VEFEFLQSGRLLQTFGAH